MYAMYPDSPASGSDYVGNQWVREWGPASHDPDNPHSVENTIAAVQQALDLRDNGGQLPDDN
ncbi:hypothetical protein WBG06_21745 [Nocardioides sp. CCNWLW239]|uniref:hypothetical protein n=1 Tax=Nocardioides sp. CCNWLW239 TaxID=3128902 RepID=UPI003016E0D0